MAYIINKYNGEAFVTLQDGTVDTTSSVQLVGRNYVGYGEIQNENFLFLLENFANEAPPARPLAGQTWFDTTNNTLSVYDSTRWTSLGTATVSSTAPSDPGEGLLWLKEPYNTLYVWANDEWNLVGPDSAEGFGTTRAQSTTLLSVDDVTHPVILLKVNEVVTGLVSSTEFEINDLNPIEGIGQVYPGINLPSTQKLTGNVTGIVSRAERLNTTRYINEVGFNGSEDITIKATTPANLYAGEYMIGGTFNGSNDSSFSVDATSESTARKIVARDLNGDFVAREITATRFLGQIDAPPGSSNFDKIYANEIIGTTISGATASAARLTPGATINDVAFDGSQDITVRAAAETLTGGYLSGSVLDSNLRTVGTLTDVSIADGGIILGNGDQFKVFVLDNKVQLTVENGAHLSFVDAPTAQAHGGASSPAVLCETLLDLGLPNYKFDNVHANVFNGEATKARFADLAEYYTADAEYTPGTVLVFGGPAEVTISKDSWDTRVAGVVSTAPGFEMNTGLAGLRACVALQGRVPCNVIGPVKKGDMLVTSTEPGYAKVAERPSVGTVIGKSLEENNTVGLCTIEVAVGRM